MKTHHLIMLTVGITALTLLINVNTILTGQQVRKELAADNQKLSQADTVSFRVMFKDAVSVQLTVNLLEDVDLSKQSVIREMGNQVSSGFRYTEREEAVNRFVYHMKLSNIPIETVELLEPDMLFK